MQPPLSFSSKNPADLEIPHRLTVNSLTGATNLIVDVPVTPGRDGVQPTLSLGYQSSAGNSSYGVGWSLGGLPSIRVSLKDGVPDHAGEENYVYEGEELVPWRIRNGVGWVPRIIDRGDYWVHLFRSKIERSFLRFEKHIHKHTLKVHWRLRDRRNVVFVFGSDERGNSRIADPADERRVFQWLLEGQFCKNGNAIRYEYVAEDFENVRTSQSYERGRFIRRQGLAQRYLKHIRYGNTRPLDPETADRADNIWRFEVIIDYGEHEGADRPSYEPTRPWPCRADPFSTYRPGFEIRAFRLCRRILMFHHFPEELGVGPTLVGALHLTQEESAAGTTLQAIGYTGYRRSKGVGSYVAKRLPPLVFNYSRPEVARVFVPAPAETRENAPYGVGVLNHRWIDLYGEGLPGILYESTDAWYYKPNLGEGEFGRQETALAKPSAGSGAYATSDFDNDGNPNLVVLQGRGAGYFEFDRDRQEWKSFRPFPAAPHVRPLDINTQLLDLDGDGRADIVSVSLDRITWYRSNGKDGFHSPVEISKPQSNPAGHAPTVGCNPQLDYFFADMTGDGRPDQVHVENGRVEYWPQLGNGRFGEGIVMEDAPLLDHWDLFDASRVRLVDLDGSGTADLLYIGRGEIRYWINAGGNRFIEGGKLAGLPYIDNVSSVQIMDFLGNGTPCLVWSSSLLGQSHSPVHFLKLTDGVQPRLLLKVENSIGKEIRLTYGNSASHYLRDKRGGRGWITRLPQHRVVVDRLEVLDHIGNTHFESLYEYHDGFFDSDAREFRGFSLVDKYDANIFQTSSASPEADFTSSTCTRTWFHNGADGWDSSRSLEFYKGDRQATSLPPSMIEDPSDLGLGESEVGLRSLAGLVIRTEVYGLDRRGKRLVHPYQVTQANYRIRRIQPKQGADDPCFATFASENLTYLYEQNPEDPRISHSLTLEIDDFGNATRCCRTAYPRRSEHRADIAAQARIQISVAQLGFNNLDVDDRYETGIPIESQAFELSGLEPAGAGGTDILFHLPELNRALGEAMRPAAILPFDQSFTRGVQARLMQWSRIEYWNDARSGALSWGSVGEVTLVHHTESACFSESFLSTRFGDRIAASAPSAEAHYLLRDGYWWAPTPVLHFFGPEQFHLLSHTENQDGGTTECAYDPHGLVLTAMTDAAGNRVYAEIDYHLLQPFRILDPNENINEVLYDPLGIVVVSTSYGDILSSSGTIEDYGNAPLENYRRPSDEAFDRILAEPERFLQDASQYFYYELDSLPPGQPPRSISLTREELLHDGEGRGTVDSRIQVRVTYLDGFGRSLQIKDRVEPGMAISRDASGRIRLEGDIPVLVETAIRWRVSGHTVFNNKQHVVRQFEPFFSAIPAFESDEELETFGVATELTYDPVGRQVRLDFPDGSVARSSYTAWESRQYDPNDAVVGSRYQVLNEVRADDDPQKQALRQAQAHADTPRITQFDPSGRPVVALETDRDGPARRTETELDFYGNSKRITDPRGLVAFAYERDMRGRVIHEQSIDAGGKWTFPNALDQPIHLFDSRGVHQRVAYDRLGRPISIHVDGALGLNHTTERLTYGEDTGITNASLRNLRGRLFRHEDQAGVRTFSRYDPSGAPLQATRRLLADYMNDPDWTAPVAPELEGPDYATEFSYDALGRVTAQLFPDGTRRRFLYYEGGGMQQLLVESADGSLAGKPMLQDAEYNARGQRTRMTLGNETVVGYEYDPETFRLSRLTARRRTRLYQDLRYTCDPVGNIVRIEDRAQAPPRNDVLGRLQGEVYSTSTFRYDAFYQLREATGRSHEALQQHDYDARQEGQLKWIKQTRHITLNNADVIRRYTRTYDYDLNGNRVRMSHQLHLPDGDTSRNWHTDFWISSNSNRSLSALDMRDLPVSDPESRFDANGNCLWQPHLTSLTWNYRNQLARAVTHDRSAEGRRDDAEYYVYGGDGLRVRKVRVRLVAAGLEVTEKIYLDGCEIKRRRIDGRLLLERATSHITDGNERIALVHRWSPGLLNGESNDGAPRIHYQLSNHLGSSSLELNEDGDIISYEEYFPFGDTAFLAGSSARDIRLKDYRYTGKECDDATGLYYYGFRFYASWLGRWLSPDPIGPQDGLNLYQFVRGNPVNLIDPSGLQSSSGPQLYYPREFDRDTPANAESVRNYIRVTQTIEVTNLRFDPDYRQETGDGSQHIGGWRGERHLADLTPVGTLGQFSGPTPPRANPEGDGTIQVGDLPTSSGNDSDDHGQDGHQGNSGHGGHAHSSRVHGSGHRDEAGNQPPQGHEGQGDGVSGHHPRNSAGGGHGLGHAGSGSGGGGSSDERGTGTEHGMGSGSGDGRSQRHGSSTRRQPGHVPGPTGRTGTSEGAEHDAGAPATGTHHGTGRAGHLPAQTGGGRGPDPGIVPPHAMSPSVNLEGGAWAGGSTTRSSAGIEGSTGRGGLTAGSDNTGSRLGNETGREAGSFLSGGRTGTQAPSLMDDVTNTFAIATLNFYDPDDPNARESGVPGGSFSWLDFGERVNPSLYLLGTLLTSILGLVDQLSETMQAAKNVLAEQAGLWFGTLLLRGRRAVSEIVHLIEELPQQIHFPSVAGMRVEVGPAFRTAEEALEQGNHAIEVIVRRTNGEEIARWFEASEIGLPSQLGHTEQKALTRINLGPDLEVEMRSLLHHPSCPWKYGCTNSLQAMADATGTLFIYRYVSRGADVIVHFIPGQ